MTAATDSVNLDFAPLGGSLYLGFEDATTGRWVGDDQEIWTTTDGGSCCTARRFGIAQDARLDRPGPVTSSTPSRLR